MPVHSVLISYIRYIECSNISTRCAHVICDASCKNEISIHFQIYDMDMPMHTREARGY
jgi:hypothetical protein